MSHVSLDIDSLVVHGNLRRVESSKHTIECYTEQALSLDILKRVVLWNGETDVEVAWHRVESAKLEEVGAVEQVSAEGFGVVLTGCLEAVCSVD